MAKSKSPAKSKKPAKKEVSRKTESITTLNKDFKKTFLKRKNTGYFILIVFLVLLGAAAYLSKGFFIAAMVNGRPISRFAVIKNLEKSGGKQALDNLVTRELILEEAKKQNVVIADEDVQKDIDNLSKSVEAQGSTLDSALAAEGLTRQQLEENIRMKKTMEMVLSSEISVSEDEVKKYFDENKESFGKDAKYEDLKQNLQEELKQEKFNNQFKQWYDKLKSESDIKYFVSY